MAPSVMRDLIAQFHEKLPRPHLGYQLQHHRQFPSCAPNDSVDRLTTRFSMQHLTSLTHIACPYAID